MNTVLAGAVRDHLILEFTYHGLPRTVEPHTYGAGREGDEILVGYQVGGHTKSGKIPFWRNFTVVDIRGLIVTEQRFSPTRPGYNRQDDRFQQIFARA